MEDVSDYFGGLERTAGSCCEGLQCGRGFSELEDDEHNLCQLVAGALLSRRCFSGS